ncbi:MAG TPA: amidase [Candidatus Acidoferrum sp.]|nr:amidase [Candidatus Acidoferrum sp.]
MSSTRPSRTKFSVSGSDLCLLSIVDAAKLLQARKISPLELVDAAIDRIARLNPALNAFITITADRARCEARSAEREIARGRWKGPLHGIPVSLKDNISTRAIRTTAGSKILNDFVPRSDAEVAARLARAGAILTGKTNLHEFAYGISSNNPHFGPVRNPWNHDRIPGGSSGGSAAAVATGMCFGSVGTDTGGSIRIPSSLCGAVGLKPTFGSVSVEGIVPLCISLDHAGPIGRTVTDVCILLETIAGEFPKDAARPDHRKLNRPLPKKLRIGWPEHYFFERVDSEVRTSIDAASQTFRSLGAQIVHVPMPSLAAALLPATNDVALAEAAHYHQSLGYFPARAADYGEDVRKRLEAGTKVTAVDYLRGRAKRPEAIAEFQTAFERVDVILAPATPIAAPPIGADEIVIDGETETVRSALVRMNRPANFTGHPAISIPCGFTRDGLPIGMQLIGPHWSEARLLAVAAAYESATPCYKHPNLDGSTELQCRRLVPYP